MSWAPRLIAVFLWVGLAGASACSDDPPGDGGDAGGLDARPGDGSAIDGKPDGGPVDAGPGDAGSDVGPGIDAAGDGRSNDGAADATAEVGPVDAADAGGSDAGDGGVSAAVWPPTATKLVAEDRGGGFGPSPPAGSTCQSSGTYTFTVADKNLAWRLCQPAGVGLPYQLIVSQRVLTDGERDTLVVALNKVMLSKGNVCGADKQVLALKITTPAGEKEYLDEFYSCLKQGVYITQIDGVFQTLRQLVK